MNKIIVYTEEKILLYLLIRSENDLRSKKLQYFYIFLRGFVNVFILTTARATLI